jgi:predicted O-methyltransferase YrrM
MNSLMNYLINREKRNHSFKLGRLEIPGNPVSLGVLNFLMSKLNSEHKINILEVGVFAGASSITMAKALLKRTTNFCIVAVDPWEKTAPHWSKQVPYNINYSNHELFRCLINIYDIKNFIHEFVCRSNEALPLLRPSSFDLIYVDGFHGYSTVRSDLINASPLLKDGGILCGDDYDCTLEYAQSLAKEDVSIRSRPSCNFFLFRSADCRSLCCLERYSPG